MNAKQILKNLLSLQLLELETLEPRNQSEEELEKKAAELRAQVPPPILSHYDRLGAQGKKGIAPIRNQTCGGCHMSVTKATIMNLMHGEDIQICENCGRYLYLPAQKENAPEPPRPRKHSPRKLKQVAELRDAA
ncbi:MAG TPA: C4-type zinc ribbon domain-containing protein [Verrucomicrobiae bacterium]|nr:C4-type zinc ribbon domain-containing protein [Verrucomicrobiae bacterium]